MKKLLLALSLAAAACGSDGGRDGEGDGPRPMRIELARAGHQAIVVARLPGGWVEAGSTGRGKSWELRGKEVSLNVAIDCNGPCEADSIPANIDRLLEGWQSYRPRGVHTPNPVPATMISEEELEGGKLRVRRLDLPDAEEDQGPVLELLAYWHEPGQPFFVVLTGAGPAGEKEQFLPAMLEIARSVEIEREAPEEE